MSLLARLIEAGTPADLIEEVAMLLAEKRVLESRRASERQRKQAQRARGKDDERHVMSRDDTGHVGTSEDTPSLSLPPNENKSNPPTHTHPDGDIPRARKADPFPCPDWAEPSVWADLRANRRKKRLADTATAHAKLIRDILAMADDEWPPGRLLEAIVARGWGAAYDPRETGTGNGKREYQTGKRNGIADALDREIGFGEPAFASGRRALGGSGTDGPRALAGPAAR